jgi:methionyl-tRNA formyltransferase
MTNKTIRIIFWGTPEYASSILEKLITNPQFEICLAISQPDKKQGRKMLLTETSVKRIAKTNNIPIFQPENCRNNQELLTLIKNQNADIQVVAAFGQILPLEILNATPFGSINVHGSILPKYRGASPVQSALLNGEKETGITIMQMNEKMDEGDIIQIKKTPISSEDNTPTLMEKLSKLGGEALTETIPKIINHEIKSIPQNDSQATYCHKIQKADGQIIASKLTANEIINRLKAFTPWPGISMEIAGIKNKIIEAHNYQKSFNNKNLVIENKKDLIIPCKQQSILVQTLQPEGKKPMSAESFINGFIR